MRKIIIHLLSEYSGQTVKFAARAAMRQFPEFKTKEYIWPLIRNNELLGEVLAKIRDKSGIVLYTISDKDLRDNLKTFCRKNKIPCISVVSPIVEEISAYLGVNAGDSYSHNYYEDSYFNKIEAIEFALKHDDGQATTNLEDADFIIIGPSRTSKTPTSVYLAFNGYKAANIPYVAGITDLDYLINLSRPLIIGLVINPTRLMEIRETRLYFMSANNQTSYTDIKAISQECAEVRKICSKNNWPVLDVSRKSIEETAASIIKMYYDKKRAK